MKKRTVIATAAAATLLGGAGLLGAATTVGTQQLAKLVSPRCLPGSGQSGCDQATGLPTGAIGGPLGIGLGGFETPIPGPNGAGAIPGHPDCTDLKNRGRAAGLNSDVNQGFINQLCGQ